MTLRNETNIPTNGEDKRDGRKYIMGAMMSHPINDQTKEIEDKVERNALP